MNQITDILDRIGYRVRTERDRRRWNRAVCQAAPGDHATVTHIGPSWITWISGPIRRNPDACPWPDPAPGELTLWRQWSAGRLMVGDTRLVEHTRETWPNPGTRWLDLGMDTLPKPEPRTPGDMVPSHVVAALPPGTKVTVWWHLDDLTRCATHGTIVDPEDDTDEAHDEVLVGDPDGDADCIPLDALDAVRVDARPASIEAIQW